MRYSTLFERLQNLIKRRPSQSEIGGIIGLKQNAMSGRAQRNSNFTDDEIDLINAYYDIDLYNSITQHDKSLIGGDRIEINYWGTLPAELRNPNIASVWFDKEIVENAWGMKADHLCIVPMIGDKMTRYWYPIRSGDILIVDTNQDQIMGNGVYFATSQNNTRFWIREMQILINQDIEIKGYAPSGDTTKTFTRQQLEDVDFRLIGKVIKNVSFRL